MYEIKLVASQAAFLALEKPWKALVDTNREAHIFPPVQVLLSL